MRYVAHASYNEIAIEGLWKKSEEIRELLEKIKNKFIVSDKCYFTIQMKAIIDFYRSCDQN